MDIFMIAAKIKLRFDTSKGLLNAESLWDLSLDDLNSLTLELKSLANKLDDPGYLDSLKATSLSNYDTLRFNIAEAIILCRVDEIKEVNNAAIRKSERDNILNIIYDLENEKLKTEDIAELKKKAESLR